MIFPTIEQTQIYLCPSTGKRCYNGRDAGEIINSLKHHQKNDSLGRKKEIPRRKYFCRDCGCYHLTKLPRYHKDSLNYSWEKKFYEQTSI